MSIASAASVSAASLSPSAATLSPPKAGRNETIDVLRGLCITMMITAHVGTATFLNQSAHFLRFVSGAEGFVFLAGLVMGFVYRRKMQSGVMPAYRAIWRRAFTIWVVHAMLVFMAVAGNGGLYDHELIPRLSSYAPGELVYLILSLKLQPGHALNVLPLYVFFLLFAPIVFEMMRRRMTWLALAASVGMLVYMQYDPGFGRWTVDDTGNAFPPLAWQGLFVPGLCIGYHYAFLRDRIIAPRRTALAWGLALVVAAAMVVMWVQTPGFAFYDHARWDPLLFNRHPLRLGRVIYFLVAVASLYLMLQCARERLQILRAPLDAMALLGRNSLYAFLMHIAISLPIAGTTLVEGHWLVAEMATASVVGCVYLLARYQVGRPWVPN